MVTEYGVTELLVNASPLENPSISLKDPEVWQSIFGGGASDAGVEITPLSVMGFPPMYRAIMLKAAKIAGTPKDVIDSRTKETRKDHFAYRLVGKNQHPDGAMHNSLQWALTMAVDAQIWGGGWSYIVRNARGEAVELVILDASNTVEIRSGGVKYWSTWIDGELLTFPDRDIVHIAGSVHGWAMIDLMRNALGLPIAAQAYSSRFFKNGSNISGFLMIPGHFPPEKVRNTMDAFQTMTQGLKQSHKVALLQDGARWQPTGVDPEKSQLNETLDGELRRTASNITGVPPHLLGSPDTNSHNSLESENVSMLQNCLRPFIDIWEAELNSKLRSDNDKRTNRVVIEFNVRDLVRMEYATKTAGYRTLMEISALTANDILRSENLPTIGEDGDKRYVPANWIEVGKEPEPMPQPQPVPPQEPPPEDDQASNQLRAMIASSVTKALTVESERVVKAAKAGGNFCAWMDDFYATWINKSTFPGDGVTSALTAHAAASKGQLLDVAGCSTTDTLAGAVAECVATWHDRGELLTDKIMGDKTNGGTEHLRPDW